MTRFFEFLVLFMIIFVARLPVVYNSLPVVTCLLIFFFFVNHKRSVQNFQILLNRAANFTFVGILVVIIILTTFVTIAHLKNDLSYALTFFSQLINLLLIIFFLVVFHSKDKDSLYYVDLVIKIFAFQGIVIMLSLGVPGFKSIIELTQSEETIKKSLEQYAGFRNLAYGTVQFFGFNATLGIVLFLNTYMLIARYHLKYLVTFLLIFIAVLFSGRTALIAFLLSVVFLLINIKLSKKSIRIIFISFIVLSIIIITLGKLILSLLPEFIVNWAFEAIINYQETGEFRTRSSDDLVENMFFLPELKTFLIGDGQYTSSTGNYYMSTDSGIMRPLLYYGFLGVFMLLAYFLYILNRLYKIFRKNLSKTFGAKVFIMLLFVYSTLLQIKGEFWGHLIMTQNVFYVIIVSASFYPACHSKVSVENK